MPGLNRSEISTSGEAQAFRLINRCVRQTCLCGKITKVDGTVVVSFDLRRWRDPVLRTPLIE